MKQYFKNLLMALLLVCCSLVGYSSVSAQEAPHVTVSGSAEQEVAPDTAYVSLNILGSGDTGAAAAQQAAQKTESVKKVLLKNGFYGDAVKDDGYYLAPVYNDKNKVSSYEASRSLKVTVRDWQKLGAVIDSSMEAGADGVSDIQFTVSDKKLVQRQLLSAAVEDARQQAAIIANAGGRSLGVMTAAVSRSYTPVLRTYSSANMKAADAATTFVPENIKVSASVEVTFALQ